MTVGFPTNTVIMIVTFMVAIGISSWVVFSNGLERVGVAQSARRAWRWGAGILLAGWLLARLALAAFPPAGTGLPEQTVYSLISLGFGLLAGILPLLLSRTFRQTVRAIPQAQMVGIQAVRIAGYLFLALMDMKLLPPLFALAAGYGDVIVGALALGMVYLLVKRKPSAPALLIAWNALGLLDFVSATTTGRISLAPFAAQVAASGMSLRYLNYVFLVPSFGVPVYALLHIYSLYQRLSGRADERERAPLPSRSALAAENRREG